jgi:hypothetical protein
VVRETLDVVAVDMDVFRDGIPEIWALDHAERSGAPEEATLALVTVNRCVIVMDLLHVAL